MSFIPEVFSPQLSTNVNQGGFRPLLFTVAAGSYASNSAYGAGATMTGNYQSVQAPSGQTDVYYGAGPPFIPPPPPPPTSYVNALTQVNYRKEDVTVDFTVAITLNATFTNPAPGNSSSDELRIGTQVTVQGEPFTYQAVLPEASYGFGCPLFSTVEILDKNNDILLPSEPDNILCARFLNDQTIALLRMNLTTSPTSYVALTVGDLSNVFGAGGTWNTNDVIFILIRGSYYAAN